MYLCTLYTLTRKPLTSCIASYANFGVHSRSASVCRIVHGRGCSHGAVVIVENKSTGRQVPCWSKHKAIHTFCSIPGSALHVLTSLTDIVCSSTRQHAEVPSEPHPVNVSCHTVWVTVSMTFEITLSMDMLPNGVCYRSYWTSAIRWVCLTASAPWLWPPTCASCTALCWWTPPLPPTSLTASPQVCLASLHCSTNMTSDSPAFSKHACTNGRQGTARPSSESACTTGRRLPVQCACQQHPTLSVSQVMAGGILKMLQTISTATFCIRHTLFA